MRKTLTYALVLTGLYLPAAADTIIFKDGMRIEASRTWEGDSEIKCDINGIVIGYPKSEVKRVVKGKDADGQNAASDQIVAIETEKKAIQQPKVKAVATKKPPITDQKSEIAAKKKVVPKRKSTNPGKQTPPAPKQVTVNIKQSTDRPTAPAIQKKKKKIQSKPKSVSKKTTAQKVSADEYAHIPSFKMIINEDDNNPPVYLKRRRVLLVSRGLDKDRIRALLLSYEKRLRNELNAHKARYKTIVVWAYDNYDRADEGDGGWIGMISNEQKSGKLSDNPELRIK